MKEEEIKREVLENYSNGNCTESEASYVENLFNDGSHEKELKKLMSDQFSKLQNEDDEINRERLDCILHTLNYNINEKLAGERSFISTRIVNWALRVAGILVIPLLIYAGWHSYRHLFIEKVAMVEINAPAWTRTQFSLPDGTSGWLNSNSSVSYKGDYLSNREVTLKGEAFFDVRKDVKHPFVVNTHSISVKVLGTRFNIASYCDERHIEVVLEEGKLLFTDNELNNSLLMVPNDLLVYDKYKKKIVSEVVQPKKYLSWTEGILVFRNDPIDVVARRLGRWYNTDVELKSDIDTNLRLRATFVSENLEEVLELLKLSLPIDYSIENSLIRSDSSYTRRKIILSASANPKNN